MFGLTPGWSTMITASNSQTSVSDSNLVETSFKNGVELVETVPGRSRSRALHLKNIRITKWSMKPAGEGMVGMNLFLGLLYL